MTRDDLANRRKRRAPRERRPDDPTPVDVCDNLEPGRIIQARGLRGWTRAELADAVGVTPATVAAWETGSYRLRPDILLRLADLFDVPAAFFRNGRPMARLDTSDVFICTVDC